jgi:hypothetical protein
MSDPLRKKDLPFPRHWLGYFAIKLVVVALALVLALHLYGMI